MATNDPLVDALRPFAAALVVAVKDELAKHAKRDDTPEFVDISTAAKLFCLAPTTVERWAKEGRLPSHRAGKKLVIKTSDLRAIVEAQGSARGGKGRPPRSPAVAPPVDLNDLSPAEAHELRMGRPLPARKGR